MSDIMKIYVPKVLDYPHKMGDEYFHPACANEYYEDILFKVLGDKGYEKMIVGVEVTDLFLVICVV